MKIRMLLYGSSLGLMLGWAAVAPAAQRYYVIDLGELQEGQGSCAYGLNNAGQVVGFGMLKPPNRLGFQRAFLWGSGTMIDLGALPGNEASVAYKINNEGWIAGCSFQTNLPQRAVIWYPWLFIADLGTLGGTSSQALGINDAVQVVGWSHLPAGQGTHAFLWWPGTNMIDLGSLPQCPTNSAARGINAAAQVVGYIGGGFDEPTKAFVWQDGVMRYLMESNPWNVAYDINDAGLVAGRYQVAPNTLHACVWNIASQSVIDLGVLPGDNTSSAFAINGVGQAVGISWYTTNPFEDPATGLPESTNFHPFLYDPADGHMTNLNSLIPTNSGWTLTWASDINDRGWIAGCGLFGAGGSTRPRAVLLLLDPTVTGQPQSQECEVGDDVSFSVTAVGTEPLFYQWWKDGAVLAQRTNATLSLTNVQGADAGGYFVVVSNQFGRATSEVAYLKVNLVCADRGFNPDLNGHISALALQPDGKILVGGHFTLIGGQPRTNLARLHPDGTVDATFTAGVEHAEGGAGVSALAVQTDAKILVGGCFTRIGGQPRLNLARLNPDGTLDPDFNPGVTAGYWPWPSVTALALQPDGKILLGGIFGGVGGQPRLNIARLNPNGTVDPDFNPGATGGEYPAVSSLALQPDGKILVGGNFTHVGGQPRTNMARLNPDGTVDQGFAPHATGPPRPAQPAVYSVLIQPDGKILVGGVFTNIAGQPRRNLARLNQDGTVDPGFDPEPGLYVYTQGLQADGKILVGGCFWWIGGAERIALARLLADGTVDSEFNARISGTEMPTVDSLAVQPDGKILIAGWFTQVGQQGRTNFARLHNTDPATQSLGYAGSKVTWLRGGTSPEVWRTTFDYSPDGSTWTNLGAGTRILGGWELDGVSLPSGGVIRARGYIPSGQYNGSAWFVETLTATTLPIWLNIARIGPNVLLSWTGGQPPYQVQKTTQLSSTNYWENVGGPIQTNSMTLPIEPGNLFLRVCGQ